MHQQKCEMLKIKSFYGYFTTYSILLLTFAHAAWYIAWPPTLINTVKYKKKTIYKHIYLIHNSKQF